MSVIARLFAPLGNLLQQVPLRSLAAKRAAGFLVISMLVSAGMAVGFWTEMTTIEELESRTWDWRTQLVARPADADKNIKIIIVDQGSLDFFEREYSMTWPIPRDAYRYVIQFLSGAGARGLAFDMLFTESSAQAKETDTELAQATGGSLPVVSAVAMETFAKYLDQEKFELFRRRQQEHDQRTGFGTRFLKGKGSEVFQSATLPIPELIENSRGMGSVHANPDSDGIFRHYRPGGVLMDVPVLSLPFALYDLLEPDGNGFDVERFLDRRGNLTVQLHGPAGTYDTFPLAAVIQSQAALDAGEKPMIDPQVFKDAYVFLGVWAPGLLDLRPTPLEEKGKGVEFVATVLDNILHQDFIIKVSRPTALCIGALFVFAATALSIFIHQLWQQLVGVMVLLALFCAVGYFTAVEGYWLPMFLPIAGMIVAVGAGLNLQFQLEGRQHRFVKGAFQYYVSRAVIDQIIENPAMLSLGGEKRDLTIFFSDIAGFTSISEALDATQLVAMLNEYLTLMTDTILATGGTVDKYVGDAVVAFWNAPLPLEGHADLAVQAAMQCQIKLQEQSQFFLSHFGFDLKTRIGLHTGPVSVGNFGSKSRFNYTMIGDSANLASRLEGVNKVFGSRILFSKSTADQLQKPLTYRKVADLRVVGKSEVVPVYEPYVAALGNFDEQALPKYHHAIELFEKGDFGKARGEFSQLGSDPVVQSYLNRMKKEGLADKIPEGWSPVWNMTEK